MITELQKSERSKRVPFKQGNGVIGMTCYKNSRAIGSMDW